MSLQNLQPLTLERLSTSGWVIEEKSNRILRIEGRGQCLNTEVPSASQPPGCTVLLVGICTSAL